MCGGTQKFDLTTFGGRYAAENILYLGSDNVIAFDEYKIGLDGMEKDITDLRDSL